VQGEVTSSWEPVVPWTGQSDIRALEVRGPATDPLPQEQGGSTTGQSAETIYTSDRFSGTPVPAATGPVFGSDEAQAGDPTCKA
jgi:hypothetical protein